MAKGEVIDNSLGPKERASVLASIRKLVLKHHFNAAGIDYQAWVGSVDQRTAELLDASLENSKRCSRDRLRSGQ